MADECPGATRSPARPSESGAEEAAEADLLASASRRALSARRRMTVVGESKACTRAATWSLRRASSCSIGRTGGTECRHAKAERKCLGGTLREKRRPCRRRWGAEWFVKALRPERPLSFRLLQAKAAGLQRAARCPPLRRADDAAAIESRLGRPGRRRAGARRRPHHRRYRGRENAAGPARGIWQQQEGKHWQP
eukprot:6212013-Pleurochrysis_carterae.AAC.1